MFKPMRREKKQMPEAQCREILLNGKDGVLATVGSDGYPYAVPLNYVYYKDEIYFHCALSGHKLDNIAYNNRVSFCVMADACVIAEKFTTRFKSVIVFGRAQEALGDEKIQGLRALVRGLASDHEKAGEKYIQNAADQTRVFKICVEHITGKAG